MRGHHVAHAETLDAQQTSSKTYDRRMALVEPELERPSWTFLTNHAHVMVALSRDGELRQRDLAYVIGITPGAVQRILDDLENAGYVKREKVGRRNRYEVLTSESLRHPLEEGHNIGELLEMLHD
jgi:DNA-binding MarR family transcriptional regulator